MLDWLDDERQRQVDAIWRDWYDIHLSTAPAVRSRAEQGTLLAYKQAGLPPPERIVWCESPLAGARAAADLASGGQRRADALTGPPRVLPLHPPAGPPGPPIRSGPPSPGAPPVPQVPGSRPGPARPRIPQVPLIQGMTWEDLAEAVDSWPTARAGNPWLRQHDDIADELAAWLGGQRWRAVEWGRFFGQPAALDLARCELLRRVAGISGLQPLEGFVQVARSAGWCWPFERSVVLTERPCQLARDDHDRLHAANGPALRYPDGFALWRWQGARVPRWVVERPDMITLEAIRDEGDVQVRRVLIERYGPSRYLREAGGEVVQRDHCGNLWRAEVPGDEPLVMIEVRNATVEPDGSRRTFWLRVPPQVLTAVEGIAWTFDLPPERYQPCVQT